MPKSRNRSRDIRKRAARKRANKERLERRILEDRIKTAQSLETKLEEPNE
jgi:hypothetical protein